MPKASRRIKHLPSIPLNSSDSSIPAQGFVEQLVNILGNIADKVEAASPKKHPNLHWRQDSNVKEQQEALCTAIIEGTNAISTSCSNLNLGKLYPTANVKQFHVTVRNDFKDPLVNAMNARDSTNSLDMNVYGARLKAFLREVLTEVESWDTSA